MKTLSKLFRIFLVSALWAIVLVSTYFAYIEAVPVWVLFIFILAAVAIYKALQEGFRLFNDKTAFVVILFLLPGISNAQYVFTDDKCDTFDNSEWCLDYAFVSYDVSELSELSDLLLADGVYIGISSSGLTCDLTLNTDNVIELINQTVNIPLMPTSLWLSVDRVTTVTTVYDVENAPLLILDNELVRSYAKVR
jgi:hypothetical protein